jgi:hypothetical protein
MFKSINALRPIILALIIIAGTIGVSVTARAIETTPTEETQNVTTNTNRNTNEQKRETIARLETAKLKICQNRETEIKNTLARISDRGAKRIDTFNKIVIRVEEFYIAKGNILDNYDELAAVVDTNKMIVQDAINDLPLASSNFTCTSDNPRSVITEFKNKNLSLNSALKNYKTSIKNLIVGVKSVQSTTRPELNNSTREQ